MKLKYLEQFDENDCGPAYLSMLNQIIFIITVK
jgi:hypothetical protein